MTTRLCLLFVLLCATASAQEKRIVTSAAPIEGCIAIAANYYDCEERAILPEGATVVASGADRYQSLALEHKRKVLRAQVFRLKDGTSLRARLATSPSHGKEHRRSL